jgi:hypothetical protein
LLRKVATALASCSAIGDAWCTGLRRDSASTFSAAGVCRQKSPTLGRHLAGIVAVFAGEARLPPVS